MQHKLSNCKDYGINSVKQIQSICNCLHCLFVWRLSEENVLGLVNFYSHGKPLHLTWNVPFPQGKIFCTKHRFSASVEDLFNGIQLPWILLMWQCLHSTEKACNKRALIKHEYIYKKAKFSSSVDDWFRDHLSSSHRSIAEDSYYLSCSCFSLNTMKMFSLVVFWLISDEKKEVVKSKKIWFQTASLGGNKGFPIFYGVEFHLMDCYKSY